MEINKKTKNANKNNSQQISLSPPGAARNTIQPFFGANNNSNYAMVVRIHIGAIWFVFKSSPINMFYKYVLMKVNFVGLKAKVAKTKEEVG